MQLLVIYENLEHQARVNVDGLVAFDQDWILTIVIYQKGISVKVASRWQAPQFFITAATELEVHADQKKRPEERPFFDPARSTEVA